MKPNFFSSSLYPKLITKLLFITILGNTFWQHQPSAIAAEIPAGTQIKNTANASFEDPDDNSTTTTQSNEVFVTMAEVAGINVSVNNVQEAPSNVSGAGPNQGNGFINRDDIVYFDFEIRNIGNDQTQFAIPIPDVNHITNADLVTGKVQIINYNNGTNTTDLTSNNIYVTTSGQTTGTLLNNVANTNNGSVPQGGFITVRVPVKVKSNLTINDKISVRLGSTPNNQSNQPYIADGNQDVYTVDNSGITNGDINLDPVNGVVEGSAISNDIPIVISGPYQISGKVFEDVNYGGGNGRNYTNARSSADSSSFGSILVGNARVELYDKLGNFLTSTLTNVSGNYTFTGLAGEDYFVRVVNNTVTSVRPGTNKTGLLPIQTFRTENITGSANIDILDRVGGESPPEIDPDANTNSSNINTLNSPSDRQLQSLSSVNLKTANISGIDFGFNFDTIVNTNNAGQGSLRQFILNSNALQNTNLRQEGQTTGREVSIFMISDGNTHPGLRSDLPNLLTSGTGNNGTALISLDIANPLPPVTDTYTSLDGTTQTINVGNTNSGQVGTGTAVGVNNATVSKVDRPEIMIDGRNLTNSSNADQYAITLNADYSILRGIGIYGTKGNYQTPQSGDSGAIRVGSTAGSNVSLAGAAIITNNLIGTLGDGSDPGSSDQNQRYGIACFAACNITQNYIAYNGYGTLLYGTGADQSQIIGNEYQSNGPNLAPGTSGIGGYGSAEGDSVAIWSASNTTIRGNLIANTRGISSNTVDSGKGIEIVNTLNRDASNNLIENNTIDRANTAGIGMYNGAKSNTIQFNIITNTTPVNTTPFTGAGILISGTPPLPNQTLVVPNNNIISKNSIYDNKGLGIDINPLSGSIGEGVTGNDGNLSTSVPNSGTDYPIFTNVDLFNDRLYLEGYVGKETTPGSGDSDFANATIEIFLAKDDGNNNGEIFAVDGESKPHGEGQVYVATITTDNDGKFKTDIDVSGKGITNISKITATATKNSSTSEFNANTVTTTPPQLYLIKRITRINNGTSHQGKDLTAFDDDTTSSRKDEDNYPYWPNNYIKGVIDGGTVRPKDEIEYTIYFLNIGKRDAQKVRICDLITPGQTYVPDTYGNSSNDGGAVTSSGIELSISNNSSSFFLTGATDSDRGEYFPPGTQVPSCKYNASSGRMDPISSAENTDGVVVVNITKTSGVNTFPSIKRISPLQNPTNDAYGFFRFRTKVR